MPHTPSLNRVIVFGILLVTLDASSGMALRRGGWGIKLVAWLQKTMTSRPGGRPRSLPFVSKARPGLRFVSMDEADGSLPSTTAEELEDEVSCEVVDEFGCRAFENFYKGQGADEFRWVRLENELDPFLKNISTTKEVLDRIAEVREEQSSYGRSDLYPREWVATRPEISEKERVNGESPPRISVMQFNTLAEGLSAGPNDPTPFKDNGKGQREEKFYGGFTDLPHPEVALNFGLRRWRLLEVILGSGSGNLFDIVAMEEVDRYYGFFRPILDLFGYEGLYMPKLKSPGVQMGWYSDGCCLFWRAEVFELASELRSKYQVGNQVFIVATLRHRVSGRLVVVAVTHLKAQNSHENEEIRCRQVSALLDVVNRTACEASKAEGCENIVTLILGDLNADPPSETELDQSAVGELLAGLDCTGTPYKSAYEVDPANDAMYTTWKTRGSKTVKRIIDYIFYGGGLDCVLTLKTPPPRDLEPAKLPGLRHPSDHMMIAATFEFRKF